MNCVRYYLCLCILMNHFNVLSGASLPQLPRIFGGVGSFFAISGFLMFASYEKHNNLKGYFVRRAKRILPPYVFIVVLAAASLCFVSSLPAAEYFLNPGFYKYLVCNLFFLNFLEPSLPGVFDTNLTAAVNGSLWTMKGEVICYLLVPFVFRFIKKHPKYCTTILSGIMLICFTFYMVLSIQGEAQRSIVTIISNQFRVFTFFFAGALINVYVKQFLRFKWGVLLAVAVLMLLAQANDTLFLMLRPFSDSLLVIWCSLVGSWGVWASHRDSLSYDIYLFHFPIIQTLLATGVIAAIGNVAGLLISIILTVLLAIVSWNFIDSPILNSKKRKLSGRSIRPIKAQN